MISCRISSFGGNSVHQVLGIYENEMRCIPRVQETVFLSETEVIVKHVSASGWDETRKGSKVFVFFFL